jgi:hypothetical protein
MRSATKGFKGFEPLIPQWMDGELLPTNPTPPKNLGQAAERDRAPLSCRANFARSQCAFSFVPKVSMHAGLVHAGFDFTSIDQISEMSRLKDVYLKRCLDAGMKFVQPSDRDPSSLSNHSR